jgi:hypothetical protein
VSAIVLLPNFKDTSGEPKSTRTVCDLHCGKVVKICSCGRGMASANSREVSILKRLCPLVLWWVALEEIPDPVSMSFANTVFMPHLLRNVVVTNTEQTNNTHPGRDELSSQLSASVFPVRANTQDTSNDGKTDCVA